MLSNYILLDAAGQTAEQAGGGMQGLIMIIVLIAIFYFFMIRPQQKRQKEIRKFREALGKGDSVVTAGGIFGKVREVSEKYFIVEVADGVRIRVDKGSVYPSADEAQKSAADTAENRTAR